jgi:hypothetical protein
VPATAALACRGVCSLSLAGKRSCRGWTRRKDGCLLSEPYGLQVSWSCGIFLCVRRIGPSWALGSVHVAAGREKGCEHQAAVQQPDGKIRMWLGGTSVCRECFLASAWEADPSALPYAAEILIVVVPSAGRARPVWEFRRSPLSVHRMYSSVAKKRLWISLAGPEAWLLGCRQASLSRAAQFAPRR